MAAPLGVPEKFRWTCDHFSQREDQCYSPEWTTSRNCSWQLLMNRRGDPSDSGAFLKLCLLVPNHEQLPLGWQRAVEFSLRIVNQQSRSRDHERALRSDPLDPAPSFGVPSFPPVFDHRFDGRTFHQSFPTFIPLSQLHDPASGFLVDDTLIIEADLTVHCLFFDPTDASRLAEAPTDFNGLVYDAASSGDVDQLTQALAVHPRLIDAVNPAAHNRCPMHAAAEGGHVNAIELLAQQGSYALDALDSKLMTPLNLAVVNGHLPAIRALHFLGNRALQEFSPNPIEIAASIGRVDVIELLARLRPDELDRTNQMKRTPMHIAAAEGHVEVIEALVRLGSRSMDLQAPRATRYYYFQQRWPQYQPTFGNSGQTPLSIAADKGRVSLIEALVRLGSKAIDTPDSKGRTPLLFAASNGDLLTVEALVRLGSKAIDTPSNSGSTPMHAAVIKREIPLIEFLVQIGSKAIDTPDSRGRTPLFFAALNGDLLTFEALVRLGSNAIDTPDKQGCTPIHATALNEIMIGIDGQLPFIIPRNGSQRVRGRVLVIEALVRLGCQTIDTENNAGCTPLHTAAWNGNVSVIEALVRLGSNAIDTPDKQGWTPLFAAAEKKRLDAIEELVRLGCQLTIPDGLDLLPLDKGSLQLLSALGISNVELQDTSLLLSEDEVGEIRYRAFFSRSLINRLLYALH